MLKKTLSCLLSASIVIPTFGLGVAREETPKEIILAHTEVVESSGLEVETDCIGKKVQRFS